MIIDTSAVIAIAFDESRAAWVQWVIADRPFEPLRISWVNVAEAEIQVTKRHLRVTNLVDMLRRLLVEPLAIDYEITRLVAHARLNFPLHFGDCYAYAHARLLNEPLLTLDADFLKTDLPRVLHPDRTP